MTLNFNKYDTLDTDFETLKEFFFNRRKELDTTTKVHLHTIIKYYPNLDDKLLKSLQDLDVEECCCAMYKDGKLTEASEIYVKYKANDAQIRPLEKHPRFDRYLFKNGEKIIVYSIDEDVMKAFKEGRYSSMLGKKFINNLKKSYNKIRKNRAYYMAFLIWEKDKELLTKMSAWFNGSLYYDAETNTTKINKPQKELQELDSKIVLTKNGQFTKEVMIW